VGTDETDGPADILGKRDNVGRPEERSLGDWDREGVKLGDTDAVGPDEGTDVVGASAGAAEVGWLVGFTLGSSVNSSCDKQIGESARPGSQSIKHSPPKKQPPESFRSLLIRFGFVLHSSETSVSPTKLSRAITDPVTPIKVA